MDVASTLSLSFMPTKAVLSQGKQDFSLILNLIFLKQKKKGENWSVITDKTGVNSTLDVEDLKDFHRQIGPNTGYIIHPDEILADNFAFLALSKEDKDVINNLKPEGQVLLRKMEAILVR